MMGCLFYRVSNGLRDVLFFYGNGSLVDFVETMWPLADNGRRGRWYRLASLREIVICIALCHNVLKGNIAKLIRTVE